MEINTLESYNGQFYFTNPTDEDFSALWNNKEYVYPAMTTVLMLIPNETPENVQEIRKRFAYKLAEKVFYNGKKYQELVKLGKGTPSTFSTNLLEPIIDQCLKPLPIGKATVKEGKKDSDKNYRASKPIAESDNPNEVFKNEPIKSLGVMPDSL